jgi:hypothetical protein
VGAISIPVHGNKIGIFLMTSLPFEELVVSATRLIGVFVAYARPGVVNRAAPGLGVEKHADASEELVLLMAQNVFSLHDFGETAPRGFDVDSEMPRQPAEISFLDDDAVVAAAVGRALGTVVLKFRFGTIVG